MKYLNFDGLSYFYGKIKSDIDSLDYLPLDGGTMTGTINSSAYNFLATTAGGYRTDFVNDGEDVFILVSDETDSESNGYIPLVINLSSGILDINGNSETTTKIKTPRTLTIGSTGKSFDGTEDISWTFDEISDIQSISNIELENILK